MTVTRINLEDTLPSINRYIDKTTNRKIGCADFKGVLLETSRFVSIKVGKQDNQAHSDRVSATDTQKQKIIDELNETFRNLQIDDTIPDTQRKRLGHFNRESHTHLLDRLTTAQIKTFFTTLPSSYHEVAYRIQNAYLTSTYLKAPTTAFLRLFIGVLKSLSSLFPAKFQIPAYLDETFPDVNFVTCSKNASNQIDMFMDKDNNLIIEVMARTHLIYKERNGMLVNKLVINKQSRRLQEVGLDDNQRMSPMNDLIGTMLTFCIDQDGVLKSISASRDNSSSDEAAQLSPELALSDHIVKYMEMLRQNKKTFSYSLLDMRTDYCIALTVAVTVVMLAAFQYLSLGLATLALLATTLCLVIGPILNSDGDDNIKKSTLGEDIDKFASLIGLRHQFIRAIGQCGISSDSLIPQYLSAYFDKNTADTINKFCVNNGDDCDDARPTANP